MKIAKIAGLILALHLIALGFFFYKPPADYFVVICVSTVIVWPAALSLCRRRKWAGLIGGLLVQVVIQQVAYHYWLAGETTIWWPLAQFLGLQYIMALRIAAD